MIAFLPSSFCMYAMMFVYACWFRRDYKWAIALVVLYTVLGWPFAALAALPLAIDACRERGYKYVLHVGLISSFFFGVCLKN